MWFCYCPCSEQLLCKQKLHASFSTLVHVQSDSTRLVTLHSLWHTKKDIRRLSNILLKNSSVTQNVCELLTFSVFTICLYPQLQWMRLETLLSPLSVPVVTWRWSRLSSTSMLIQRVSVHQWLLYIVDGLTEPVNMAGDTLLSLAYERGHFEMVKYLVITHHCDTKSKNVF